MHVWGIWLYFPSASAPLATGTFAAFSLAPETFATFAPSESSVSTSASHYFFVIPRTDEIDPALAIVDPPGAEGLQIRVQGQRVVPTDGRFEVVLGKLLPYLGIGLFDVALTVVAGMLAGTLAA